MLLLRHQLVKAKSTNNPMVFLGWDLKVEEKGWFVKIDHKGEAVVDWFNSPTLSYIKVHTANTATPGGMQIAYGKFVGQTRNSYYHQEITPENLQKFGSYLKELIEKYKEKTEASEQK